MLYLSQMLGTSVEDQQRSRSGKLIDVLIPEEQVGSDEAAYPGALLVEGEADNLWRIPLQAVERHEDAFRLRIPEAQLTPYQAAEREVQLAQDVLDKQVIDIEHRKAVRVNDICFDDDWRVLGIDTTTLGLIRRLAPPWLLGQRGQHTHVALIPWADVELIGAVRPDGEEQAAVPTIAANLAPIAKVAHVPTGHLGELHPADIAEIVHQLTSGQGARLIERLDDETAADTMEEIDTERQLHILDNLAPARAATILQAMGPDEVADLLAQMPQERAQELLRLMEPEDSEEVQELLGYEKDTAGGLMTTDYIVLNQTRTAQEALETVRTNIREQDVRLAYIYCVKDESQEEQHMLGVISLWDLLIAAPTQTLAEIMEMDVVSVQADSDAQSVAEIMAKYNLLAVPVVDENETLQGVITVDDVLDVLLPPERRRRPTRMY
ncbi:MAG TPA: CBS domain-containing protein [Ktedonobacteraceae bacterium]|jgi:CBS domain-containing protein|nr:CBS domain-containing protein [Ktedonobacteraceae bacterium]